MCSQVKPISHQFYNGGNYNICIQIKKIAESLIRLWLNYDCNQLKMLTKKNCQTHKTAKNKMVNTLAGSYNTSEMVVMRNLRLPELDKNRNVDQQKALVFESKTCKYDVILGADFLTKTGIDVKYSTRIIEWFDNELPLRDP